MRFTATIEIIGVNPYIFVSPARARSLRPDWRRPMPVLLRINGEPRVRPWRTNMMPIGDGSFRLYLQGTVRRASETSVGDTVCVDVCFDAKYRGGPQQLMPAWFSQPLRTNRRAWAAWQQLTPSRKKEMIRYLAQLKSPAARERNVARALNALSDQPVRYMGRSWGSVRR